MNLKENVSILVLMDITLLHHHHLHHRPQDHCFNPCFNGYYTSTNANVINAIDAKMFQSLF